jgi:LmbE family N-acetylglucosaminyl deacetylase
MKIVDYIKQGFDVKIHCISKGGIKSKEFEEVRVNESLEAAKLMGVKDYTFSSFKDSELENYTTEIKKELEEIVEKYSPDIVYTLFYQDNHSDHEVVSKCANIASRSIETLIYFRSPYSLNFIPKIFFFGNSKQIEQKMKVLEIFQSAKLIDPQMIKSFCQIVPSEYLHPYLLSRLIKKHIGQIYAEMFIPERIVE